MRALPRTLAALAIAGGVALAVQGVASADTDNSFRDCSNSVLSPLSCNDLLSHVNVLSPHDNNNVTYRGVAPVAVISPVHYTPPVGTPAPPVGVTPCPRPVGATPCPTTPPTYGAIWYVPVQTPPVVAPPTYGTVGATPCPVGVTPPPPAYCDPCAGR